jgi:hypothetical protein
MRKRSGRGRRAVRDEEGGAPRRAEETDWRRVRRVLRSSTTGVNCWRSETVERTDWAHFSDDEGGQWRRKGGKRTRKNETNGDEVGDGAAFRLEDDSNDVEGEDGGRPGRYGARDDMKRKRAREGSVEGKWGSEWQREGFSECSTFEMLWRKERVAGKEQDAPFPNPFHLSISDEPPKLVLEHVSLSAERLHEPRELRRPEFSAVGLENGSEELGKEEEKRQFSIASMQSSLRQCRESGTHA